MGTISGGLFPRNLFSMAGFPAWCRVTDSQMQISGVLGYLRPRPLGYLRPRPLGYLRPRPLGYLRPRPLGYLRPRPFGEQDRRSCLVVLADMRPAPRGLVGLCGS